MFQCAMVVGTGLTNVGTPANKKRVKAMKEVIVRNVNLTLEEKVLVAS